MAKETASGESGPSTLGRLCWSFTALAAALLAVSGAGLYFIAAQSVQEHSAATTRLAAEATARDLAKLAGLAGSVMDALAQDPELAQSFDSGDPARILGAEQRLSRLVPGAALVRLVPRTLEAPDEQREPRMGFADLDAVRQAGVKPLPPTMHAANTPDAHIALVRKLGQGNGVILASLAPKFIASGLAEGFGQGALELRQAALSLAFHGDAGLKSAEPSGTLPIPGTPWTLAYWNPPPPDAGRLWFLGLPALAALLIGVVGYVAYRRTRESLRQDRDQLMLLIEAVLSGQAPSECPMRVKDLQGLAAHLLARLAPIAAAPRAAAPPEPPAVAAAPEPSLDIFAKPSPPPAPVAPLPVAAPPVTVPAAIFRAYGIRGVVGKTLTPEIVQLLGRAIGSEARERGEPTVAVARDGRLSSSELSQALGRGLMDSGCSVIDVGVVPTPVLYFATHVLNTESGVMVTGGHEPAGHNGLKIVIAGDTLDEKGIQKLRARIERGDFASGTGQMEFRNIVADYMERIVHDTQLERPLKIVVDCGNGIAGDIVPALLDEIGCEVLPLFCAVDGNFPNHLPEPSDPANLATLIRAVKQEQADLGLAFDGDGDRIGVVDSSGKIIWPDRLMMLFAADVLSREPGSDIVFDVSCTRHLPGYIVRHGGRPLMWKSGHAPIKAKIKETGALLGGEMRGYIFFKERWYGFDDAIYACARLVEILSIDPRPSAEVFAELPDSVSTPELSIALKEGESLRFIERLREAAHFPNARITDIDGLRVDFADGWGLVRASTTAPALLLRFEADNAEALARIQGEFKTLMQKVQRDPSFH